MVADSHIPVIVAKRLAHLSNTRKEKLFRCKTPLRLKEIAVVIFGATSFLIIMFLAIRLHGSPITMYFRDPAATLAFSPLAGIFSHLGVFALVTASVISIFASYHVYFDRNLLFWVGAFSLIIAADDFFMIHEDLALVVGLSELHVLAFYGALALIILLVFRTSLIGRSHIGLYTAIALLAASVVTDITLEYSGVQTVLEDSLKFVGLILWSSYWVLRAHFTLSERLGEVGDETQLSIPKKTA